MKEYFQKLKYLFSWKDLAFTALIFVLIIGLAMCKADKIVQTTFGEDAVDIVSSRYSMNIPYDMVEHIELADAVDDSELLNGKGDMAIRTGIWTNEVWGEHYACLDRDAGNCIVVYLNDGRIFVFSRSNDEETAADFEMFQSYLNR